MCEIYFVKLLHIVSAIHEFFWQGFADKVIVDWTIHLFIILGMKAL